MRHEFQGCFEGFRSTAGSYRLGHIADCGNVFQGVVFWVGCVIVRVWHIFQGRICGRSFWVL
jgi:hypothetical protein